MKLPHPIMYSIATVRAKISLMREGNRLRDINAALEVAGPLFNEMIDAAIIDTEATPLTGAFGDGQILKMIDDFFKTDLGKMIMQLIKDLIASLMKDLM